MITNGRGRGICGGDQDGDSSAKLILMLIIIIVKVIGSIRLAHRLRIQFQLPICLLWMVLVLHLVKTLSDNYFATASPASLLGPIKGSFLLSENSSMVLKHSFHTTLVKLWLLTWHNWWKRWPSDWALSGSSRFLVSAGCILFSPSFLFRSKHCIVCW